MESLVSLLVGELIIAGVAKNTVAIESAVHTIRFREFSNNGVCDNLLRMKRNCDMSGREVDRHRLLGLSRKCHSSHSLDITTNS